MTISNVLIELLTFKKSELEGLAEDLKLDVVGDKFELARQISQNLDERGLQDVAGDQLGAGQVSLTWVVLEEGAEKGGDRENPVPGVGYATTAEAGEVSLDALEGALRELTGEDAPFDVALRPEVSRQPKLVNAQLEETEGLVLFTMVYQRTSRTVIKDFDFKPVPEDSFFHVALRLGSGVIEVRSEARIAHRVIVGWVRELAEQLGRFPAVVQISQVDVDDLKRALGAVVARHDARHEDETYGRQTVTGSNKYPDVTEVPKFKEDFKNTDSVSSNLRFAFDGTEVHIKVSNRAGTIQCLNHVPASVIDHIYETLRQIRAA